VEGKLLERCAGPVLFSIYTVLTPDEHRFHVSSQGFSVAAAASTPLLFAYAWM